MDNQQPDKSQYQQLQENKFSGSIVSPKQKPVDPEKDQKRFQERLIRDLKRGRLSEKTKNQATSATLQNFSKSIGDDKRIRDAFTDAIEHGRQQSRKSKIEIEEKILEPVQKSSSQQGLQNPIAPRELESFMVNVCYNGKPAIFKVYGGFARYL